MENKFICHKCGLCCQNLDRSEIYNGLHNGDGICKYFDAESKLCTIYENRPDLCNVDLSYDLYFKEEMTKESYYRLNNEGCRNLWMIKRKNEKKLMKLR